MKSRDLFLVLAAIFLVAALWYGLREVDPQTVAPAVVVSESPAPPPAAEADAVGAPEAETATSTPVPTAPSSLPLAPTRVKFEPTKKELELLGLLERHRIDADLGIRALEALHSGKRDEAFQKWLQSELRDHVRAKLHIANWAAENGYIQIPARETDASPTTHQAGEKPRKKVSPVKTIAPKK